jgi:hypothetical protein
MSGRQPADAVDPLGTAGYQYNVRDEDARAIAALVVLTT